MLKYISAKIRLSELHAQNVAIPAWELPILQAVHGAGVSEVGELEVDRPAPEAADEFQRLAMKYRHPENSPESPFVAQVYGAFGPGISRLAQEIERAVIKPKAKRAPKVAAKQNEDVDPLVA
jgi:hypothetical protein